MEVKISRGQVHLPPKYKHANPDVSIDDKNQPHLSNQVDPKFDEKAKKYKRETIVPKIKRDPRLKRDIEKKLREADDTATLLAKTELFLTEEAGILEAEGLEKTFKFTQEQLKPNLSISAAAKSFDLKLDKFGPYAVDYTRDGRRLLIAGRKGHLASIDWKAGKLNCELHLKETVRDVKFLHNETMFAVAQKKYVYIYDNVGREIHCLKQHREVSNLEYLPYHYLLSSISSLGMLRYLDVSTGKMISEARTTLGKASCLAQNIQNAVIHSGHACGTVALWSPNSKEPLVKILSHMGPVRGVSIDLTGRYMATAGLDGKLKVWDLREYKPLYEYTTPRPAASIQFSQRGILAVGFTGNISLWKDVCKTKQISPYMNHKAAPHQIHDLQFCPYEDVLGFGHSGGFSSLVVPGAGEPNFDSLEVNLYETVKQRREREVHSLLNKIQPDTITLDTNLFGTISKAGDFSEEEEKATTGAKIELRNRARGKSSSASRFHRKKGLQDLERKKMLAARQATNTQTTVQLQPPRASAIQPNSALD
ncbi:putative U3 small nucleolar RNA-associated protein 7, partial [Massospora cicadina]